MAMKKRSKLFSNGMYHEIEEKVKRFLNEQDGYISEISVSSTRAVGDAVQSIIEDNFEDTLSPFIKDYTIDFARRAMEDLAFSDMDGFYYVVDVKTHRLDTEFNMPNLTSVKRLSRFYEDDNNYFVILMVKYIIEGTNILVDKVHFVPVEFLSWACLTMGALGWGQIQIANANNILVEASTRQIWMLQLCDILEVFYEQEIIKIGGRREYFAKVRAFWETKNDI